MADYQRCKHLRGMQNTCGAGIDTMSTKQPERRPLALACLTPLDKGERPLTCPSYSEMSKADHEAEAAWVYEAAAGYDRAIKAGKCPECGTAIEPSRVVGKCRYAACGHRLGQVETCEP